MINPRVRFILILFFVILITPGCFSKKGKKHSPAEPVASAASQDTLFEEALHLKSNSQIQPRSADPMEEIIRETDREMKRSAS